MSRASEKFDAAVGAATARYGAAVEWDPEATPEERVAVVEAAQAAYDAAIAAAAAERDGGRT